MIEKTQPSPKNVGFGFQFYVHADRRGGWAIGGIVSKTTPMTLSSKHYHVVTPHDE